MLRRKSCAYGYGAVGPVGTILGSFATYDDLVSAHTTGNQGDAYLVEGGKLYVWNVTPPEWRNVGNIQGPEGSFDTGELLFRAEADTESANVGYNESLKFESSTLDIEVTQNPATVTIENPKTCYTVQFSSVTTSRIQAFGGERSTIVAVGLGHEQLISVSDPVQSTLPALSIKLPDGGTIKKLHYFLSLSVAASDVSPSVVHARLYKANPMSSKEFTYVPDTEVEIAVAYFAPVGSSYERSVTLSEYFEPGTQLVLVFYNTSTSIGSPGIEGFMSGVAVIE